MPLTSLYGVQTRNKHIIHTNGGDNPVWPDGRRRRTRQPPRQVSLRPQINITPLSHRSQSSSSGVPGTWADEGKQMCLIQVSETGSSLHLDTRVLFSLSSQRQGLIFRHQPGVKVPVGDPCEVCVSAQWTLVGHMYLASYRFLYWTSLAPA